MASYPYPNFSKVYSAGANETITVSSTAIGFTATTIKPASGIYKGIGANAALVIVVTQPITWRCDGTDATAAGGLHSLAADVFIIEGQDNVERFSAIRTDASDATLYCQYYW